MAISNNRPIVTCIKVGTKYSAEYVYKLAHMLAKHTTYDYEFLCLTDDQRNLMCKWRYIDTKYPGWWAKMELFKRHHALEDRRVIYLDLDTVIVGNIDFLFEYQGDFAIVKDWWAAGYNSSVMSMSPDLWTTDIYDRFVINANKFMENYAGDQDWITDSFPCADLFPSNKIGSYKANDLKAGPGGFPIVCFHGDPKPHTFKEGWVHDAWV